MEAWDLRNLRAPRVRNVSAAGTELSSSRAFDQLVPLRSDAKKAKNQGAIKIQRTGVIYLLNWLSRVEGPAHRFGYGLYERLQDQDTKLRMPNKWQICKDGQADNKKKTTLRLACVF
jgi:hypothetical protein